MTSGQGGGWLSTKPAIRDTLARLSWDAETVWWKMRLYCSAVGNDGVLPHDELHVAMDRKVPLSKVLKQIPELVRLELLVDSGGCYRLPWDDQPPAAVWHDNEKRDRWARGRALLRNGERCREVKKRDRNLCRYCGIRVDWNNKVGPGGATYDHIDPDGDNSLDNVVVSCRRCNGRKRDRTPDQAGMTLLPAGTTAEQLAELARPPDPGGSTPGQPPADPRSTRSGSSRARPDRVSPGSTPGQPIPTHGPAKHRRAHTEAP